MVINEETGTKEQQGVSFLEEKFLHEPTQQEIIDLILTWFVGNINEADKKASVFYIKVESNKIPMWIDKETRNSLLNVTLPALLANGEATTKLWATTVPPVSFDIPIKALMIAIPQIELYAKQVYDNTQSLIAEAYSKETREEIEAMRIDGYPEPPVFLLENLQI